MWQQVLNETFIAVKGAEDSLQARCWGHKALKG